MLFLSLLWLALLGVLYYGLFPVLVLAHHFNKYIVTGSLLCLMIFMDVALFTDQSGKGMIVGVFIATSFILPSIILMLGMSRNTGHMTLFYLCHLPGVLCALYYFFFPIPFELLNPLIEPMMEKFSSMNSDSQAGELAKSNFYKLMERLLAVFWLTDLSIRLIIGSAILSKIQRSRKINLRIQNLRVIQYPDWPVWIVITGLSGLFYSLYFSNSDNSLLSWFSTSILVIISPMYFLRGLSVVFDRFHQKKSGRPWPVYLKFLLILLILWAGPTLVIVAILFGTLDTWINFRKKYTEQLN